MQKEKFNFIITDQASKKIIELSMEEKDNKIYLRITVDGGGCSGFMYQYDFTNKIEQDDISITHLGATIIIDSLSQEFLNGSKIDYIEELGAEFFQISNPQAKYKCGCGNSCGV